MFILLIHLALAGERKIDVASLPAAVTAAVQTRLPGAVVVGAAQDGKSYEANVTLGDRKLDLAFAADGFTEPPGSPPPPTRRCHRRR